MLIPAFKSTAATSLHRKPTIWKAAAFLVLGMGFGQGAWSACGAELDAAVSAIERRGFSGKNLLESHRKDEKNCFRETAAFPTFYRDRSEKNLSIFRDVLRKMENGDKELIKNNSVAEQRLLICQTEASLGPCGGSSKPGGSGLGIGPLQSQTQETQQRAREAQARADAQRQAQPQAAAANPHQSQTQESQQRARDVQVRADADAQRKGKRSHDPAAEAHECITNDTKSPGFGSLNNSCAYKVWYTFCNFRPKKDSWAEFHDCEKRFGLGADEVRANGRSATHVKNTEYTYWYACKDPSWPVDTAYVPGQGITGRCRDVGK